MSGGRDNFLLDTRTTLFSFRHTILKPYSIHGTGVGSVHTVQRIGFYDASGVRTVQFCLLLLDGLDGILAWVAIWNVYPSAFAFDLSILLLCTLFFLAGWLD